MDEGEAPPAPKRARSDEEEAEAKHPDKWSAKRGRFQCAAMDNGVRCTNNGRRAHKEEEYLCMRHGGKHPCTALGCMLPSEPPDSFCSLHKGQCKWEGCSRKKLYQSGHCAKHNLFAGHKLAWVLVRDSQLREKWIDVLLAEQGGRCAQSFVTCEAVDNGAATSVCPWGDRPVPRDAAHLEHIQPKGDGGTDDKENLQALCACCHALKTADEGRARARAAADRKAQLACLPCAK